MKIQRALISVTDKTGLADFAKALAELGIEIVSTGGTARALEQAGVSVREVSDVTGFPEMLDGRLKTIHPRIAGGVLARRDKPDHMSALAEHGIGPLDLVVVNLYAFEQAAAKPGVTLTELMENIDIGGPTLIRAAAKNYCDVAVVVRPSDYPAVLEELRERGSELSEQTLWNLAKNAFALTAAYDAAIAARLEQVGKKERGLPEVLRLNMPRLKELRYGENPHQPAALYFSKCGGIADAAQLQGKELSYNNLVDLDAAWQLVNEFDQPASAIIKHTNPCGCAQAEELAESYIKAFEADPVSAYGGVLAFNRELDGDTVRAIGKTFVEAIAAPEISPEACEMLASRKNVRLLRVKPAPAGELVIRSISGGVLAQTPDVHRLLFSEAEVKTPRVPSQAEWKALDFAWRVVKHVKSNAIVFARDGQTVSVGAGQMSRVDAVKVAVMKAVLPLAGCVLASDAFFPFADSLEEAANHGITAVIQPGGSVRDEEVIAAAGRLGLAMVFTGVRHFRH